MTTDFQPYDYQKYAIDKILDNKKYGLFLDMGLGKTVSTLTAIDELMFNSFEIEKVLVIAPKYVAEHTWAQEAKKWSHLSHLTFSIVMGTPKQRRAALSKEADIYVTNKENTKWLCEEFKKEMPFDMLVIDELSTFKSHDSQRFKAIKRKMPLFDRFVGLTGTPASNGLMNLWSQIYLIDAGERLGKTFTGFRARFFYPAFQISERVSVWEPYAESEQAIYSLIDDVVVSMKSEDYLELPELIWSEKVVKLSSKERGLYKEMEEHAIIESLEKDEDDESEVVALTAATVSQKLLQISNGAVYNDEGSIVHIHDRKLDMLKDIEQEAQGQPLLVFYNFKHDKERILQEYPNAATLESDNVVERWNNGEFDMLLVHPASAGHGLNIQYGGHIIVWFGLTWSLELYEQANARLYRQGQKHTTIIHHIMTEDSIDQDVYKSLKNKSLTQNKLMAAVKARSQEGQNGND